MCLSTNQENLLSIGRSVIILKKKELWQNFCSVQVDQIILKVRSENLVKVAGIKDVMSRRRSPILREP